MKRVLPVLAGIILLCVWGCESGPTLARTSDQIVTPDAEAVAVANKWLSIVDAGNYAESHRQLAPRVRAGGVIAEQQFVTFLKARRAPLGRPLSRTLARGRFSHTIAGGPDGNYEFLDYKTSFQRKAQAVEIVTLTKESGNWQVSGYHLR